MYKKMCMRGIEATDTTYTALISAYAKADRLEDALAAYKIMVGLHINFSRHMHRTSSQVRC